MTEIVSGLRMGAKLWEQSADEMPRMTGHSRWLMTAAADEIERLRGPDQSQLCVVLSEENDALIEDNKRLRTALTELLADLDDPELIEISAATISRARQVALNIQQRPEPK